MRTTRGRMQQVLGRVDALGAADAIALATVLSLVVIVADVVTGGEVSFSIFYVLPIAVVAWRFGRPVVLPGPALAAACWFGVDAVGGREYSHALIPVWNGLVRFGFFLIIANLIVALRDHVRVQTDESRRDPLTGLLNRRGFAERAAVELGRAVRAGRPVTIAFLDVDRFKQLNDSAGHAAGDDLLRALAGRAAGLLRGSDLIGRMGGDEFAILLPETDGRVAPSIIERLHGELVAATASTGAGISIGVVSFDPPPADLVVALDRADRVMYLAKAAGAGTVRYELVVADQAS